MESLSLKGHSTHVNLIFSGQETHRVWGFIHIPHGPWVPRWDNLQMLSLLHHRVGVLYLLWIKQDFFLCCINNKWKSWSLSLLPVGWIGKSKKRNPEDLVLTSTSKRARSPFPEVLTFKLLCLRTWPYMMKSSVKKNHCSFLTISKFVSYSRIVDLPWDSFPPDVLTWAEP